MILLKVTRLGHGVVVADKDGLSVTIDSTLSDNQFAIDDNSGHYQPWELSQNICLNKCDKTVKISVHIMISSFTFISTQPLLWSMQYEVILEYFLNGFWFAGSCAASQSEAMLKSTAADQSEAMLKNYPMWLCMHGAM